MKAASCVIVAVILASTAAEASAQAQPPSTSVPAKVETAPAPPVAAAPTGAFDPRETFAPVAFPEAVNGFRSADGTPGPDYWQNRADYDIAARLDPAAKTIAATETITYTNNSPSTLTSLWVQLDQNVYRPDARRAVLFGSRYKPDHTTEGYAIETVAVERDGLDVAVPYLVSDTRMQVRLDTPLKGRGDRVKLRITYRYVVPGLFGGRTAWVDTKNGPIFDVAQWYPRMAVFDDLRGWDTLPYIAQEFYLEYGDIDYAVTLPADMMVMGSGDLTNPQEVLTAEQRQRLSEARASDATVLIRTPEEVAAPAAAPAAGEKTWRYHMADTRDVAFTASRAFVWDAARMTLPDGKTALAESVYPVESAGPEAWGRSTAYLKDAVERFSRHWFPYPYPTAVSVAGGASGMEYPGLVFDGIDDKGKVLFWITAHEIGHTWFPMVVGSDERRDAWMDEGINTFIDTFESDEFEGGVYGPKRDSEYAESGGNPVDVILPILADPEAPPIMTRADLIPEKYRHAVTYFKAGARPSSATRRNPGAGALRPGLSQVHRRLGLQTPEAERLFPRHGERGRRGPLLVVARLVHGKLAARSRCNGSRLYGRRSPQGGRHNGRNPRQAGSAELGRGPLRGRHDEARRAPGGNLAARRQGRDAPRRRPADCLGHGRPRPTPSRPRSLQQYVRHGLAAIAAPPASALRAQGRSGSISKHPLAGPRDAVLCSKAERKTLNELERGRCRRFARLPATGRTRMSLSRRRVKRF